ncbi:Response regulator receiver domain-containing protein [Natronorubrum sediminis]|uniref:Response regulator receiver domain-containing protein n=2 Tax=Natronorubrum sediminis TaxID=640943 RepID=A0A1H6FWY8_9EURY|nr:Response regulator receiver domain-containing protein [Natronorubrum sediminis]
MTIHVEYLRSFIVVVLTFRMDSRESNMDGVVDILLVEPNPGDTRLFSENFKDAKLLNTIHSVSNGELALEFVHQRNEYENAPRPDIILLEPQLPGTSGMDVLAELKADHSLADIPVVILTSSDMGEAIVKRHDLEADCYIRKPVAPEEFVEFIQSLEEFWFAIIKNPAEE